VSKDHKSSSTASLKNKFQTDEDEMEGGEGGAAHAELLEHPSYVELQNKLTEAEEKASQSWDRMLRMQAETENMQRRMERDIANAHKYGLEKFVNELLPIIDNLERATSLGAEESSGVIEGIGLTLQMLYTMLKKFGIEQVDPISQPFNPELHQAVSTQVDTKVPSGTVLNVLQKGYLLNNRLIRPALVVVSKES
jgi:molecular chaperone GrpE